MDGTDAVQDLDDALMVRTAKAETTTGNYHPRMAYFFRARLGRRQQGQRARGDC